MAEVVGEPVGKRRSVKTSSDRVCLLRVFPSFTEISGACSRLASIRFDSRRSSFGRYI